MISSGLPRKEHQINLTMLALMAVDLMMRIPRATMALAILQDTRRNIEQIRCSLELARQSRVTAVLTVELELAFLPLR